MPANTITQRFDLTKVTRYGYKLPEGTRLTIKRGLGWILNALANVDSATKRELYKDVKFTTHQRDLDKYSLAYMYWTDEEKSYFCNQSVTQPVPEIRRRANENIGYRDTFRGYHSTIWAFANRNGLVTYNKANHRWSITEKGKTLLGAIA